MSEGWFGRVGTKHLSEMVNGAERYSCSWYDSPLVSGAVEIEDEGAVDLSVWPKLAMFAWVGDVGGLPDCALSDIFVNVL